jgi:hypothetical protein
MARTVSGMKVLAAANAAIIAASQTPGGAGLLTLVSSPVVLDDVRRVLITSAGNNSGVTFTVTGTSHANTPITETVAGANAGTSQTVNDFGTVNSISISGASTGAVTVGTSGVGSTRWINLDTYANPFLVQIDTTLTGAGTFSIETTNSNYLTPGTVVNVQATAIIGAAASASLALTTPKRAWRLTLLSGAGAVAYDATQSGY